MGQLNSFIEPRPNGANYGGYTCDLRRLYISKFKKPLLGRTGRGPTTIMLMIEKKLPSWGGEVGSKSNIRGGRGVSG